MNTQQDDESREVQRRAKSSQQQTAYRLSLGDGLRAMRADRAFSWLIMLFFALNMADLVVTLVGLRLGGFEANPLFNPILSRSAVTASLLKLAVHSF